MSQWVCGSRGKQCPSVQNCYEVGRCVSERTRNKRESHPFCTTLNAQLSSIALCVVIVELTALYCSVRSTSAILGGAHSYFVISSFKCEGKNSCHDIIPNHNLVFKSNQSTTKSKKCNKKWYRDVVKDPRVCALCPRNPAAEETGFSVEVPF